MCKRKLPRPAPSLTARPPAPPPPPPIRGTALDEVVRLRAENAALRAAVERVLALHEVFGDWCDRCDCVAPCATLRALEGTP